MRYCLLSLAALALVSACVQVTPALRQDAAPEAGAGYVAGAFAVEHGEGSGFGFQIVDADGGQHLLSFTDAARPGSATQAQVGMISLPPGPYRVARWLTYSMFGEKTTEQEISSDEPLGRWFSVLDGHIVFLGSFTAETSVGYRKIHFRITPQRIHADQVPGMLAGSYARFAGVELECVMCMPPVAATAPGAKPAIDPSSAAAGGAATLAATVPRPSSRPVADSPPTASPSATPRAAASPAAARNPGIAAVEPTAGDAVVHLHLRRGDSDGWTLTTWHVAEDGSQRTVARALAPSGADDFGVYWVLPGGDYPGGTLRVLAHKGSQQERVGVRSIWFHPNALQVWLNVGDPRAYSSVDLAIGGWVD
jgi:hypothetical protein